MVTLSSVLDHHFFLSLGLLWGLVENAMEFQNAITMLGLLIKWLQEGRPQPSFSLAGPSTGKLCAENSKGSSDFQNSSKCELFCWLIFFNSFL